MPLEDVAKERLINDLIKLRERVRELEKIKEEKETYAAELAHTKSMFEGLFRFAPDAILVMNHEGAIVQANQEAERLFGYAREELIGLDHDVVVPDRFHERHLEQSNRYMSKPHVRRMGTGLELYGRRKDGTEFPVDISLGPLQANDENVTLAVVRDITELKKVASDLADRAAELQQRTAQIEEMNKELESFSYSVSHDLRAPLRAIDGYSRMILKKHADKFDQEALGKFNVIRENARMMDQLIEQLLAFSRLGKHQLSPAKLDLENQIGEIWKELAIANPGRRLTLNVANLPPCQGDRVLIRQVFANVLANAVKFTGTREEALIEVGGEVKGSECLYYIRDNGVGFDMKYHDKMFGVFQRLHRDEEFEGTGVGLSIVQRIVHRHGGRVWAEGEVGKGATFYFTLPTPEK